MLSLFKKLLDRNKPIKTLGGASRDTEIPVDNGTVTYGKDYDKDHNWWDVVKGIGIGFTRGGRLVSTAGVSAVVVVESPDLATCWLNTAGALDVYITVIGE